MLSLFTCRLLCLLESPEQSKYSETWSRTPIFLLNFLISLLSWEKIDIDFQVWRYMIWFFFFLVLFNKNMSFKSWKYHLPNSISSFRPYIYMWWYFVSTLVTWVLVWLPNNKKSQYWYIIHDVHKFWYKKESNLFMSLLLHMHLHYGNN